MDGLLLVQLLLSIIAKPLAKETITSKLLAKTTGQLAILCTWSALLLGYREATM